jgi:hypothetical protein
MNYSITLDCLELRNVECRLTSFDGYVTFRKKLNCNFFIVGNKLITNLKLDFRLISSYDWNDKSTETKKC